MNPAQSYSARQLVVRQQYETIRRQSKLIAKQEKLLHLLSKIIDNNNLGHLLDDLSVDAEGTPTASPASSPDDTPPDNHANCGPPSYGPEDEKSIIWTGTPDDLLEVDIKGWGASAMIMENRTINYWNILLDLRRMIPKFKAEYKFECNIMLTCQKKLQSLMAQGIKNTPEYAELYSYWKASGDRSRTMKPALLMATQAKKVLNRKLARIMRRTLMQNGIRESNGTGEWIDYLKRSQTKYWKWERSGQWNFEDEEEDLVEPFGEPITLPNLSVDPAEDPAQP